jgi:alkylation response protein AidB-like acyl-CoA dehydrogenase
MFESNTRLLDDIRVLAPDIICRSAEIEAGRRIPLDIVASLKSIGIFRMFVPRSHGGLELDLPAGLEIIRALGRIDGSVGWTAMIGSGASTFASLLPRETYDRVYRHSPDVIIAGSAQPAGTAEKTAGGWRVNGRWPFASGCQHADWILGLAIMTESGMPLPGPAGQVGPPLIRGFLLPAHEWQIEDTWHVVGLKGTGSHHVALSDTFVPAENFFDLASGVPCLPGPLYRGVSQFIPLLHGTIAVSIAEGALEDIVNLAKTGRQQLRATKPMQDSEIFQGELGHIFADLRAAQAFLQVQVASHWRRAVAGTLKDETLLAQGTQTAIWLATTCVRVADACFALGAGSALYENSPLQRRMLDLHVAAQHGAVQRRHYVGGGKLLLESSSLTQKTISAALLHGPECDGEGPSAMSGQASEAWRSGSSD